MRRISPMAVEEVIGKQGLSLDPPFTVDPAAAASLLDEAGWSWATTGCAPATASA